VFAFLGAKGGVGTTTLAVNVATALAQSRVGRVLFADLHPAYGDAALFFGAEPKFSVLDALENTHRLDEAFLKGLVVRTKTGLDLLASSDRSTVGSPDAQRVRALIEFVSRHYAHVVLDVPRSDSSALDALDSPRTS
jgi:pilus assembly protein CpaE